MGLGQLDKACVVVLAQFFLAVTEEINDIFTTM